MDLVCVEFKARVRSGLSPASKARTGPPACGAGAARARLFARDRVRGGGRRPGHKAWAVSALADGPVRILGSTVELSLSRNSGSAFSLFQGFTPLLALVAVVVAAVLVRAVRRTDDRWAVLALSLVLGGALGNLADRAFRSPGFLHGAVVDS